MTNGWHPVKTTTKPSQKKFESDAKQASDKKKGDPPKANDNESRGDSK